MLPAWLADLLLLVGSQCLLGLKLPPVPRSEILGNLVTGRELSRETGGGALEHTVNDLPSATHKKEGIWSGRFSR